MKQFLCDVFIFVTDSLWREHTDVHDGNSAQFIFSLRGSGVWHSALALVRATLRDVTTVSLAFVNNSVIQIKSSVLKQVF